MDDEEISRDRVRFRPTAELSLEDILVSVASGDRAAFEEVYHRTSAKLFGVCLRILPDRSEAEDTLQTAYLSVWRNAAKFDAARGSPMTWLITLARNCAIDRYRSGRKVASAPIETAEEIADPAPIASELAETASETHRLNDCLAALEACDAGFIRTAFFEGSTYSELATRAAMPLGTLKSRVRRALLKLRDCLA